MITDNSPSPNPKSRPVPQPSSQPSSQPMTATETVFEKLLADIVSGTYPPDARLPAERDLAKQLGASRPTLREALRRLGEWNLVKPRRGSGIVVQAVDDWMIDVLPSYLRYAEPGPEASSTPQMIKDLLRLRRSLMQEIMSMAATRVRPEAAAHARAAMHQAWESRDTNPSLWATADLEVLRSIVKSARLLPGLWMLNQMSGIYKDLAKSVGTIMAPPESYVAAWDEVLDALENQDADLALARMTEYLKGHDERLMTLLELLP